MRKRIVSCLAAGLLCCVFVWSGALPAAASAAGSSGNLKAAPTVVMRLEEEEQLASLGEQAPASLIAQIDADGNAVDGEGASLGAWEQIYEACIQADVLPIAMVADVSAADAFIDLWQDTLADNDMAVMSADAPALATVRTAIPGIRGIYDCSAAQLSGEEDLYFVMRTSTLAMANVVVLGEKQATAENVAWLQGRLKTVWVQADGEDAFAVQSIVSSGAYGIVCTDPASVYAAYRQYPQDALARTSINIAHRGLPMTEAENSLAGAQAAVAGGATHIEIDVHLTSDGHVIIMHDDTIDRTTNGSGAIAGMTLAQIRQYSITKTYDWDVVDPQPIPTAEEIFEAFAGTGVVIVCEIKTSDTDVLPALEKAIEAYDFWDQIVFISFDLNMLQAAHEQLPQVPTASLASFPSRQFSNLAPRYNAMNTVVDAAMTDLTAQTYYDGTMKDRGYMSFAWTYSTAQDCDAAMAAGLYGLTNNDAAAFGTRVCALQGEEGQVMTPDYDAPVRIVTETYAGETAVQEGSVFSWRDCGTYAQVIAYCRVGDNVLFTPAFRVDYPAASGGEPADPSGSDPWLIIGCSVGGAVVVAGAVIAAVLIVKKKKKG